MAGPQPKYPTGHFQNHISSRAVRMSLFPLAIAGNTDEITGVSLVKHTAGADGRRPGTGTSIARHSCLIHSMEHGFVYILSCWRNMEHGPNGSRGCCTLYRLSAVQFASCSLLRAGLQVACTSSDFRERLPLGTALELERDTSHLTLGWMLMYCLFVPRPLHKLVL